LSGEDQVREKVVSNANKYMGTRYKYGGTDKRGVDCSGLVYLAFGSCNIALPRVSVQQSRLGKPVPLGKAQVGDIVYFKQKGKINHVGIVSRNSRGSLWVTHSTTSQGVIEEDVMRSSYWSRRVEGVRDVISR